MSDAAHSPGAPPATDTPTATVADKQPAPHISMDNSVVCPINHATRDPKFGPGVGQAFFSTELGARAPRSLGPIRMPVIARSVQDAAAVVKAATHWQTKYKNHCLCIFPSQGWTVEDLWDAEDLHLEGRKFCEEMLKFISRSTYYAADRFAKDWARVHPDRVNFTGLQMGNVYDLVDPIEIVDQIFIFGESLGFPRVFLWHVAHILTTTWIEMNKATDATLRNNLTPQARTWCQPAANGGTGSSSTPIEVSEDKSGKSSSAVDKPDGISIVGPEVPDQPNARPVSHRIPSQGLVQSGGHPGSLRGGDAGIPSGPSRPSPNMHALPLNVPKGNRNMASGSYSQQTAWVENNNRTMYGAYPRQPSGPMPLMQSPHFIPQQMAMGQHIPQPMVTAVPPYVQMAHHAHPFQHSDPGMMTRAQVSYQQGIVQPHHMSPAFPQQPHGQHVSMGDMTNNMHHMNNMVLQHQDPRLPMPPRRFNPRNTQDLYDPYGGNNQKFNGAPGYNNGGRKGGNNGYATQPGRGRKVSNPAGREAYTRSNADYTGNIPPGGHRHADFNTRRRPSEDDPTITGDSVFGCGQTWIGPKNLTVNELWVGDLLPETTEGDLIQMFKQGLNVMPVSISMRTTFGKSSVHAFVTFASSSDAKTALGITKFEPLVRGVRPMVTVPRRFYQKDLPSTSSYFDQSHVGQTADRTIRESPQMSNQQDGNPATDTDSGPAAASGKALYSPQDARSGLSKKPSTQLEVADGPETGDVKLEIPKRQQKSPAKKNKGKGRRESPVKSTDAADETTKTTANLSSDGHAITKEEEPDTKSTNTVTESAKPASVDAAALVEEHVTSPSDYTPAADQPADAADNLVIQPSKGPEMLEVGHDGESPTERNTDDSTDLACVSPRVSETASDAVPAPEDVKNVDGTPPSTISELSPPQVADDNVSDDEAKNDTSFHSAPEIQPESVQAEPQPKIEDKAMTTNQGALASPSAPTETSPDNSATLITGRPTTTSDQLASAPPKEDDTPLAPTLDNSQGLTANGTALDSAAMSVAVGSSPAAATKKVGAQQVQSLHPFAKSNKSQAKREREAKKKQQKKEDADRITKAKADKAASSKKSNEGLSAQLKTASLEDSANSSTALDALVKPEVTLPKSGGDTTTGNKKSKGKARAQTAGASPVDYEDKVVVEGENGKLNGAIKDPKESLSVTHKAEKMEAFHAELAMQESSERSGTASASEPTPSPALFVPSITPKAQAPPPAQEDLKSLK